MDNNWDSSVSIIYSLFLKLNSEGLYDKGEGVHTEVSNKRCWLTNQRVGLGNVTRPTKFSSGVHFIVTTVTVRLVL